MEPLGNLLLRVAYGCGGPHSLATPYLSNSYLSNSYLANSYLANSYNEPLVARRILSGRAAFDADGCALERLSGMSEFTSISPIASKGNKLDAGQCIRIGIFEVHFLQGHAQRPTSPANLAAALM